MRDRFRERSSGPRETHLIYFDHNASTPVRPEAAEAIRDALAELHANPSSMHREGQRARAAIERARDQVAGLVGARPDEIVFTSGGTEGDHMGLIGAALALDPRGRRVAISAVEHHAVHGAADLLSRLGFEVEHVLVDPDGAVAPASLDALPEDTTVLSVMLANNETGVIQPVAELARRARAKGIRVHCDAVQAAGKIPIDFEGLGVDYLVISAHKLGGPKGVGALVVRRGAPFEPLFRGSAHERGRRGGTENLPGIVGLGVAARLAADEQQALATRLNELRDELERRLLAIVPDAVINGWQGERAPHISNVSIPGTDSEALLMHLDLAGIACSSGSACSTGTVEPSHVLTAMGVPRELGVAALRFSFGKDSTVEDVEAVTAVLPRIVEKVRSLSTVLHR